MPSDSLINRIKQNRLVYVGLAVYLVLFIYGFLFLHQAGISNRIVNELWDLGHIFAYAILLLFVVRLSRTFSGLSLVFQFILAAIFACLLGILIEFIQLYTGRTFSLHDVLLNVVGALTAVALVSPKIKTVNHFVAMTIRLAVVVSLLFVSKNAIVYGYDGYQAHRQFPVLFDLSSPFELTRWRGQMVRVDSEEFENSQVLHAEFLPARYSTLIFDHFPRNWQGYKQLEMVIYNPADTDVKLDIRIHDLEHFEGVSPYSDRFNSKLVFKPGWNTEVISLDTIRQSPRKRPMNMRHIHQLMLYFPNLTDAKTLLIRKISLTD